MTRHAAMALFAGLLVVTGVSAGIRSGPSSITLRAGTITALGGSSSGGGLTLVASAGEGAAGTTMTSASFSLTGGFIAATRDVDPAPCPADVDGNGSVNTVDLLALLGAWGPCPGCAADINGDGVVSTVDLLDLLGAWGTCP